MQSSRVIYLIVFVLLLFSFHCKKTPQQNLEQFNSEFFAKYVPEFPDAKLMTKADIPEAQQEFFDEAEGTLQLLYDLNGNGIPEYVICGYSQSKLSSGEKAPYFIAIFENTEAGIQRLYVHQLLVPPVDLDISKDETRRGIIISFAFFSDYAAEIYFQNDSYNLDRLF